MSYCEGLGWDKIYTVLDIRALFSASFSVFNQSILWIDPGVDQNFDQSGLFYKFYEFYELSIFVSMFDAYKKVEKSHIPNNA